MSKQINPDLTDEQKRVLFSKDTEYPGTGKYLNHSDNGQYTCANCGSVLFNSDSKYKSNTPGLNRWPSFDNAVDGSVNFALDNSFMMNRTDVSCSNCGVHLGHVFDDDDAPSGTHFCINSVALDFDPEK